MSNVDSVIHNTIVYPKENGLDFANKLSEFVVEGYVVLSSGWDGASQGWWAVVQKIEYKNSRQL